MRKVLLTTLLAIVISAPRLAVADTVNSLFFDLTEPITAGSRATQSGAVTASFTNVSGGVQLVLTNTLTPDSIHVKDWYFNVVDSFVATSLSFQNTSATPLSGWKVNFGSKLSPSKGEAGYFDIKLSFPNSNTGNRFTSALSPQTFLITSTSTSLSASIFDAVSVGYNKDGLGYYSAVHIGGFTDGGSTKNGDSDGTAVVPLPPAAYAGMALMGLVGAARLRRARRQAATAAAVEV